jgi:hypothetical protein
MGKLVLRKTILRNMIDRVWAALELETKFQHQCKRAGKIMVLHVLILSFFNTYEVCGLKHVQMKEGVTIVHYNVIYTTFYIDSPPHTDHYI